MDEAPGSEVSVHRKILVVALTAVALAVTVFGVPLAVLISRNVVSQERTEIQRQALRAAVQISPRSMRGVHAQLLHDGESGAQPIGLYDATGRLIEGTGPPRLEPALASSLRGSIAQATASTALTVAVPLSADQHVFAVLRVASPLDEVAKQIHHDWLIVALLGIAAAVVAGLIATVQSRRLAAPMRTLERVATELGSGNLGARAPSSGVAEIDRASGALNATAARLGDLIAREQAFSTRASHQLRTPLTGLRLQLEAGLAGDRDGLADAARSAIRSADELSQTIDDVLRLSRRTMPQGPSLSIDEMLRDTSRRWTSLLAARGRLIRIELEDPPTTKTPAAAIRQVLDVLVDNAYRHGRGVVTLRARESAGALAIDVIDEGHAGPLLPPREDGLGLALATSIAAGQGGRLVQAIGEPATRMTALLPGEDD